MEYNIEKISNNIQKKKKIITILEIIFVAILVTFFVITTFVIKYDPDEDIAKNYFGLYVFDIISGSMVPELNINDIVIVKKIDVTKLKIDDIITFRHDNVVISHRIIDIAQNDEKYTFFTKGDHNEYPDDFTVDSDQIYGKVIYQIPHMGRQVKYLHEQNGLLKLSVVVLIVYFMYVAIQKKKYSRKKIRWKYETKKKREKYKLEEAENDEK